MTFGQKPVASLLTLAILLAAAPHPGLAQPAAALGVATGFTSEGTVDAPIDEVWKVWSTSDGYRKLGPAMADVDLRLGGLIRSKYTAEGTLDDEGAIVNRILAYEPMRMIAIQIARPPAGFPFEEAWRHPWTVITLTPEGASRTHVRVTMLGFGSDEESVRMRTFFERGNAATIDVLRAAFSR
jgi:uncharacterized protein YndB with AHSA1/START domain